MKLMKNGIEFFDVHEHEYDINILNFRYLPFSLKNLQFNNQKFNIQFYVHDQMTIITLKQLLFDRIHKSYDTNIGLEFENADGYIYDNRIAATLKKNEIIGVNTFEIKLINYTFEFDGGEADMESNNNITVYELEQQLRENFCLGKNVKLFANMKKINKQNYIKNYEKFQLVYKTIDKQYSMCEMIDRQFEVIVRDKSYNFVGRFFNGWDINRLEDNVGTYMGNRKNNFIINFENMRFDPYNNVSFYDYPDKIKGMYVANSKRKYPKYFIVDAKQLLLKRFIIDYNNKLFTAWINGYLTVSEALSLWNISFETHDYYEYDGKLIDQNMMMSQNQFLLTTKIFTAKDRLNGGGKICNLFKTNRIHDLTQNQLEILANYMNENTELTFLQTNKYGITDMIQTEEWSWRKLYSETNIYTSTSFKWLNKEEGCVNETEMMKEVWNKQKIGAGKN
jgi:hypothetical protein